MNKVYLPGSDTPLTPFELAREANAILTKNVFEAFNFFGKDSRVAGKHCSCSGNGEFELLPIDDPDVIEGGKRYMRCRICGEWSHL